MNLEYISFSLKRIKNIENMLLVGHSLFDIMIHAQESSEYLELKRSVRLNKKINLKIEFNKISNTLKGILEADKISKKRVDKLLLNLRTFVGQLKTEIEKEHTKQEENLLSPRLLEAKRERDRLKEEKKKKAEEEKIIEEKKKKLKDKGIEIRKGKAILKSFDQLSSVTSSEVKKKSEIKSDIYYDKKIEDLNSEINKGEKKADEEEQETLKLESLFKEYKKYENVDLPVVEGANYKILNLPVFAMTQPVIIPRRRLDLLSFKTDKINPGYVFNNQFIVAVKESNTVVRDKSNVMNIRVYDTEIHELLKELNKTHDVVSVSNKAILEVNKTGFLWFMNRKDLLRLEPVKIIDFNFPFSVSPKEVLYVREKMEDELKEYLNSEIMLYRDSISFYNKKVEKAKNRINLLTKELIPEADDFNKKLMQKEVKDLKKELVFNKGKLNMWKELLQEKIENKKVEIMEKYKKHKITL